MAENKVGVGVGVLIFNDKGQFMLQKRLSKHGFGTYALPGGWLEYMEDFDAAARREVMEEHGVEVNDIKVLGVTNNFFPSEEKHTVSIILGARLTGAEPKIMEPHKCEKIVWREDWDNLPEPMFCQYNKYVSKAQVERYRRG